MVSSSWCDEYVRVRCNVMSSGVFACAYVSAKVRAANVERASASEGVARRTVSGMRAARLQ